MKMRLSTILLMLAVHTIPCLSQWTKLPGAVGGTVWSMILNDDFFLAPGTGGLYRSEDHGQTWSHVPTDPAGDGRALFQTGNTIYYSIDPRGIFSSVDFGKTWQMTRYGSDSGSPTQCFAVWHGRLYSGGYHAIREYRDSVWRTILTDPNRYVRAMAADDRALFKGTDRYGVVQTTDGGATWSQPTSNQLNHEVRSLLIHGDTILAGFYRRVALARSIDHGVSWVDLASANDMNDCYALLETQGVLFAGGSLGVFRSTDFGDTWDSVRTGMREVTIPHVYSLAVYAGYLYAGTGNWIWRRPLSELLPPTVGVEEASTGVSTTSLGGAVPNPSSGSVVVPYRLGTSCSINLSVYNAVGEQVAMLVNERQGAGAHSASFDVSALPAGVYYYRLSAGAAVLSRSMVVAR